MKQKSKEQVDKKALKEKKLLLKFQKRKSKKDKLYLTKKVLVNKFKNSQSFTNANDVTDEGMINLRTGEVARVYSVDAIDLSLTSNTQKNNFFVQLKYLYQIKGLNLRMYKLDDKIDLNVNKDYYKELMDKFSDDEIKMNFLEERYSRLERLEKENLTTTSRYYFVIICDNDKILEHMTEEIEIK